MAKADLTAAAELSWAQVHAFRLQRHHLTRAAPKKDLARVVSQVGGVQAQVMSSAELQIAVRVNCTVADVRRALWTDRTLVKTWLMRGTLHLVRAEDLPLYAAAMSARPIGVRVSWLKFWDVSQRELWSLVDEIGAALNGPPLTREQLIAVVGKNKPPRIREALRSGWGGMLKLPARDGLLCFGPSRGQSVTFVRPQKWLHSWQEVDQESALLEIGRRYLHAYGPATKTDFARWFGGWRGSGSVAWSGLKDELVPVSVEGRRFDALAADIDAMRRASLEETVQLLPAFDPYLMGYASRDHLVERAFASRVSRIAGWISPVVLHEGIAVGTWTHAVAKNSLHVSVAPFRRLTAAVSAQIRSRAATLARALGLERADVKVVLLARD